MSTNPPEVLPLVAHLSEHDADLVHPLLSVAREDHLVCGCKPLVPADVNRCLEFRQFLFYERLKFLEVLLLFRIVGTENLQLAQHLVEILYRFAIGFKVGLISCQEKASLSRLCINEPSRHLI